MQGLTSLPRFPRPLSFAFDGVDCDVSIAIADCQIEKRDYTALFYTNGDFVKESGELERRRTDRALKLQIEHAN